LSTTFLALLNVYLTKNRSLKDEHESFDVFSALGFSPDDEKLQSLRNFQPIKQNTACVFAKRSLLWGSPNWVESLSLEQNAMRIAPALKLFMTLAKGSIDFFELHNVDKANQMNI
jgi:hypothetical protein